MYDLQREKKHYKILSLILVKTPEIKKPKLSKDSSI